MNELPNLVTQLALCILVLLETVYPALVSALSLCRARRWPMQLALLSKKKKKESPLTAQLDQNPVHAPWLLMHQ